MPSRTIGLQYTEVYDKICGRAASLELEITRTLSTYVVHLWKSRNGTQREIIVRKEVHINSERKEVHINSERKEVHINSERKDTTT